MAGKWAAPKWRRYTKFMRRVHPWCTNCRARDDLQTHHLKYPKLFGYKLPLWMVPPWWLMVLCANCHSKVTKRHRSGRFNHYYATVDFMGPVKFNRWKNAQTLVYSILALPFIALVVMFIYAVYSVYTEVR